MLIEWFYHQLQRSHSKSKWCKDKHVFQKLEINSALAMAKRELLVWLSLKKICHLMKIQVGVLTSLWTLMVSHHVWRLARWLSWFQEKQVSYLENFVTEQLLPEIQLKAWVRFWENMDLVLMVKTYLFLELQVKCYLVLFSLVLFTIKG